jgi:wyosine [tRNA(Phe)-imidazoG37] synthetase (radical SAM superfamily)
MSKSPRLVDHPSTPHDSRARLKQMQMRLRAGEQRYQAARMRSGPHFDPYGAEAIVRAEMASEFGPAESRSADDLQDFVAAVEAGSGVSGLMNLMAALAALENRDWDAAGRLAERVTSADQHDLFAQRVLLSSREHSRDLHLEIDDWLADRFCGNPFEEIEVRADGQVNMCCSAWMPQPIGSIHEHSGDQYWNSIEAAEIRGSILHGDFSYCSRLHCPKIKKRALPLLSEVPSTLQRDCIDLELIVVEHKPRRVILSEDRSCNLSCPSCRRRLIQLAPQETEELDRIFDEKIEPMLAEATQVKITGSGDPFGSRHFRHVLARLTSAPALARRIQIQTNGVLMDEKAWVDLNLEGHVSTVWVSIDAARRETYEMVRRGGSFDRLCRNLRFLGKLRAENRFDLLRLDFVVQAMNFREMPEFVQFARSVGADGVHFLMLRNWGTYAPEDYRRRDVGSPNHPENEEFLAILAHPQLSSPYVDIGNAAE